MAYIFHSHTRNLEQIKFLLIQDMIKEGLIMSDMAKELGVSERTLARYFKDANLDIPNKQERKNYKYINHLKKLGYEVTKNTK